MLYVFAVGDTGYLKVGYTSGCPWARARDGFWRVLHPSACCGQLGWENLQLLLLSPGTMAEEKQLHECVPPEEGECYPLARLPDIQAFCKTNGYCNHGCGADDWEMPLPPKPEVPIAGRGIERRPCCGGTLQVCYACQATFQLWIHLSTHMRESCPERPDAAKTECGRCGDNVIHRNLQRHRRSKRCRDSDVVGV